MEIKDILNKPLQSDAMALLKSLPDKSVDVILTDIPYNEVNRVSNWLRKLDKGNADVLVLNLQELLKEFDRVCKWSIYVFCGFRQFSEIMWYFKDNNFSDRCIVWEKTNPSPMNAKTLYVSWVELCAFGKRKWVNATYNGWYKNTVLRYPTSRKIGHTTPKNLEMFKFLLEKSTKEGDIVLDTFAGSFTTAVAAKLLNRNFICSDLEQEYVDIWTNRLAEIVKK